MVHRQHRPPCADADLDPVRNRRGRQASFAILRRIRRPATALLIAFAALGNAGAEDAQTEALRQRVEALRSTGDARIGAGSAAARALVASLYERHGFAPLWAEAARERSLRSAIDASATHGLDARDYHADALAASPPALGADGARALAERDVLLTDAFVRLAYHLHFGKADPRTLQPGWNYARRLDGADPEALLAKLLAAPDPGLALEQLSPRVPMYRDLRQALSRLRDIEKQGGWPRVDVGPRLELGATGPGVQQVRARLRASGDLADGDDSTPFDGQLDTAVRRFQARHGIEADGVVGRATVAAMNVTVAERIAQVRANLERLRWVARELGGDYLLVDIAGFSAELWLNDVRLWRARVVVGRPFRTTPEFRATMKYLVLNPEWNVPPTILREDVLPRMARDPAYLRRHGMRVIDGSGGHVDPAAIDWARYRTHAHGFPYQIVQAPGADNPLGSVKFMFPNEHSVYLHDTPSRALFDKTVRAFSSGCIRTENPIELAALLLDDPRRWSEAQLHEAVASGRTQTVPVRRTVPVLLLYFTASARADGTVQFRRDLYARDAAIITALAAPFRFSPVDTAADKTSAR